MSGEVAHSNPLQPSQSLIKSICYPCLFSATTKATPLVLSMKARQLELMLKK